MKKFFSIMLSLLAVFTLVSCVKEDKNPDLSKVDITGFVFDNKDDSVTNVTGNFKLPTSFEGGITATWESDSDAVKIDGNNATVTPSHEKELTVNLTATLKFQPTKGDEIVLKRDPIVITIAKLNLEPVVTGDVFHWMPNSIPSVTAHINLKDADKESVEIKFKDELLVEGIDFEIFDDKLEIYSEFLREKTNELGDYVLEVKSEFGSTNFTFHVVDNPSGTSIPTKEIKVADMGTLEQVVLTEPIADAPELLITEVAADAGKYSYIEVFNNSSKPKNLKGHIIMFGDLTKPTVKNQLDKGLIPWSMGSVPFYIKQDLVLEPFETGIIWYIRAGNKIPWSHAKDDTGLADYTTVVETATSKTWLLDSQGGDLTIEGFMKEHQIKEGTKIAIVRDNPFTINNTTAQDENGFGTPVYRGGGFNSVNSSVPNRAIQIHYFDPEIKHEIHEADPSAPENAAYFKVDTDVLNWDEDLYENKEFKVDKIVPYANRMTVNLFYFRLAYYDANDNLIGYDKFLNFAGEAAAKHEVFIDLAVDAIQSTAVIFPKLTEVNEVERWGLGHGMEYLVPNKGSHMMRFIPRSKEANYLEYIEATYTDEIIKNFVLQGLGEVVDEMLANRVVEVPVDEGYSYVVNTKENSSGVVSKYNLGLE